MARITKSQAEKAAKSMAATIYNAKIDLANLKVREYTKSLLEKYIPKPLQACFKEYPEWFTPHSTIWYRNKDGYERSAPTFESTNPCMYKKFPLTLAEIKKLEGLKDAASDEINNKHKFIDDMTKALVTLKTEKRISETLPDALPYINFSGSTALVPQYQELNTILKTLNKKQ